MQKKKRKFYRVADQIHIARRDSGFTVSKLAEQAKVSRPTVRSVEQGSASLKSMRAVLGSAGISLWIENSRVENLGGVLALLRSQQGLSQRELAKCLGVTQPTVVALETRNSGRMDTLQKCLNVLQVDLEVRSNVQVRKRRLIPAKNDAKADRVYTPRRLAKAIISQLPLQGSVLDPCKGDGAFFDQFPIQVEAHWCELDFHRDFFVYNQRINWVVTNPPWSKFRAFLDQAMHVADNVVFLAAFSHFSTKARVNDIRSAGFAMRKVIYVPTPVEWPASGFQMAAVWLQRGWSGPCEFDHL